MIDPTESEQRPPTSQEIEAFDVFGESVRQRLETLAKAMDELNEKSVILEYEWVFDQEEWYLYKDAMYDRCRLISVAHNDDGTYTVVAAKAWAEDKELLVSGQVSPKQYVRYVSPKAQVAHFSQGASRILGEKMMEQSARFSAGDVTDDVNPHEYLYEAAFGRSFGINGVQIPEIDVDEEYYKFYRDVSHLDIINQAVQLRSLSLNYVREPAWEWGIFNTTPNRSEYLAAIRSVKERSEVPELDDYQLRYSSYDHLLSRVKSKMSRLWNSRYNIDSLFFISPGNLDPEMAGLYQTRFEAVIKEVEQMYTDHGYDPALYQRDIYKSARIRIHDIEFENSHEIHAKPVVWSKQETVEALLLIPDDMDDMVEGAIDNSLLVRSLYGEMPAVLEPSYRKMAALGIRNAMSTGDLALVSQFVVLPKRLTVKSDGEIVAQEPPKTMREWVEAINQWSIEYDDASDYAYYMHEKPDGSILYAELKIRPDDDTTNINEYANANSSRVLLANFYPNAVAYLRKYYKRDSLQASDFHKGIHIKQFGDRIPNDGNKNIEFVHNA